MDRNYNEQTEEMTNKTEFDPGRFFESFIDVGRQLILQPRQFFRNLPKSPDIKSPSVFLTVCAFFLALFYANFQNADYRLFLILFFSTILSAFITSYILNIIVWKVYGVRSAFSSTFRIIAYTGLMNVVSWIPVVGLLAYLYGIYLIILGLQETYRLNPRQALGSLALIVGIEFLIVLLALLMASGSLPDGMGLIGTEGGSLLEP